MASSRTNGARTALLVDDSGIARLVLRRTLEGLGFSVSDVDGGPAALATLERDGSFDLAIIDWNMPGMQGPDLIREIRARGADEGMHLVLCSATEEGFGREKAATAGSDDFLPKPFTAEQFQDLLDRWGS